MTDKLVSQMMDYYHQRAPIYDESMGYTDFKWWQQHVDLVAFLREKLTNHDLLEIACGPGHWSQVVAIFARSVVATDVNEAVITEAHKKNYPDGKVCFQIADAYTLDGIGGQFTAGFSVDWWSHIPKSRVSQFLRVFHRKLVPGARVVFIDQMPRQALDRMFLRRDSEDNLIQSRWLPSGQQFEVIKNFPTQGELLLSLGSLAKNIEYFIHDATQRWVLAYTVA